MVLVTVVGALAACGVLAAALGPSVSRRLRPLHWLFTGLFGAAFGNLLFALARQFFLALAAVVAAGAVIARLRRLLRREPSAHADRKPTQW